MISRNVNDLVAKSLHSAHEKGLYHRLSLGLRLLLFNSEAIATHLQLALIRKLRQVAGQQHKIIVKPIVFVQVPGLQFFDKIVRQVYV